MLHYVGEKINVKIEEMPEINENKIFKAIKRIEQSSRYKWNFSLELLEGRGGLVVEYLKKKRAMQQTKELLIFFDIKRALNCRVYYMRLSTYK